MVFAEFPPLPVKGKRLLETGLLETGLRAPVLLWELQRLPSPQQGGKRTFAKEGPLDFGVGYFLSRGSCP